MLTSRKGSVWQGKDTPLRAARESAKKGGYLNTILALGSSKGKNRDFSMRDLKQKEKKYHEKNLNV